MVASVFAQPLPPDPELDLTASYGASQNWAGVLGDYQTAGNSNAAVLNVLDAAGKAKLMEGTQPETFVKRKAFLKILAAKSNALAPEGTNPAIKKIEPENYTLNLEKLLGADGILAYQEAIEEEYRSAAFREAVFVKSTGSVNGPKWLESPVTWTGGASSSGKSYLRERIVNEIEPNLNKDPSQTVDNYFVSVDGGVERDVTQIRSLVLGAVLQKGYSGIRDLHEKTEGEVTAPKGIILKNIVKEALLVNKSVLGVVIPETFNKYLFQGDALDNEFRQFAEKNNTVLSFAKIYGGRAPAEKARFQRAVQLMGESRAWSDEFTANRVVTLNQKLGCESKKYDPGFMDANFKSGIWMSARAREIFARVVKACGKKPITSSIAQDLVHVVEINGEWVEYMRGKPEHKGVQPVELITQRALNAWHAGEKHSGQDLPTWYNANKAIYASVQISTFIDGVPQRKLQPIAPAMPRLAANLPPSPVPSRGNKQPQFKFNLFNNFHSADRDTGQIIWNASIKTAQHFFGKNFNPKSIAYSPSRLPLQRPGEVPSGIYHVVVSKMNFNQQYPAMAHRQRMSPPNLGSASHAPQNKLQPNQIALNFVESPSSKHNHGCYVEQLADDGTYQITTHRLPPVINKNIIFTRAIIAMSDPNILRADPDMMSKIKKISHSIHLVNGNIDLSRITPDQQALLSQIITRNHDVASFTHNLLQNYSAATDDVISDGTYDYIIPSPAYLDFAAKQCQSFFLNQGEDTELRILPKDIDANGINPEDPRLITAYEIVCKAYNWDYVNLSNYSKTHRPQLDSIVNNQNLMQQVRLHLNITSPNVSPAPSTTPPLSPI
jgi:hypothetical protein